MAMLQLYSNTDFAQADRDIAAKMGHRVADDGFYIPSPMLPPQIFPQGQAFSFPAASHTRNPWCSSAQQPGFATPPASGGAHHQHYRPPGVSHPWYVCEGYAPATPPAEQTGNFFQFPPIGEMVFKQSPRRQAIPHPVQTEDAMTPPSSALLKEEPTDPRYSCDVRTPDVSQASGPSSAQSGYFSSRQPSPDGISPTESVATVEDILRTCAVVLGDCDIGLGASDPSPGEGTSCEDILSPDVIPSVVTSPAPIEIIPSVLDCFSDSSDYSTACLPSIHPTSDVTPAPGVSYPQSRDNVSLNDRRLLYSMYDVTSISTPLTPLPPSPFQLPAAPFPPQPAPFKQEPVSFHQAPSHFEPSPEVAPFKLQSVPTARVLQARKRARLSPEAVATSTPVSSRSKRPKMSFPCQYCPRTFTSTSGRGQHENTHTGERPFKCDFCPLTFAQRSTMRTHRRSIHTKERPYKCLHCPRAFSDYSTHVKHERTHTGAKPYVCSKCDRAFSQSGNLYRHQATKHKDDVFTVKEVSLFDVLNC